MQARNKTALVTGSSSGLGKAIAAELEDAYSFHVIRYDIDEGRDVNAPQGQLKLDSAYSKAASLDVLVNCAGINRISWLQDLQSDDWDEVMNTNAKGIMTMTQALLTQLKAAQGTVLNIVSNAAHMPMRCSAAYNASKGAALILTKQLARELAADDITVFSVSPNKLKGTGMSNDIDEQVMATRGWTREEAQAYQLQGLLTGEETDVDTLAEFVGFLLSTKQRHKFLAGCDIPYGL